MAVTYDATVQHARDGLATVSGTVQAAGGVTSYVMSTASGLTGTLVITGLYIDQANAAAVFYELEDGAAGDTLFVHESAAAVGFESDEGSLLSPLCILVAGANDLVLDLSAASNGTIVHVSGYLLP